MEIRPVEKYTIDSFVLKYSQPQITIKKQFQFIFTNGRYAADLGEEMFKKT